MKLNKNCRSYFLKFLFTALIVSTAWEAGIGSRIKTSNSAIAAAIVSPSPDENYPIWGLDLSHHQPKIKWESLCGQKPSFLIFKATEGTTHSDKCFKSNWSETKKRSIIRGAYHFFSYTSPGALQAKHFIRSVKIEKGDLPPVLDIEFKKRMPKDKWIVREIKAWLKVVETHYKVKPIIYVNECYYNRYIKNKIKGNYHLWICDYKKQPNMRWTFWQVTDSHTVDGIDGYVDKNVFAGSERELYKLTVTR